MPRPSAALALVAAALLAAGDGQAQSMPAAPERGGPRHFEVTGVRKVLRLRRGPSAETRVIERLENGTVVLNYGCLEMEGEVWCDVRNFLGGERGFALARNLVPAPGPDGTVATGPDDSALRAAEGRFDATGQLYCAAGPVQPTTLCPYGVARAGGGDATVVVTLPGGAMRAIHFTRGVPLSSDAPDFDPAAFPFAAAREGDVSRVTVGPERYEIPDAVVLGG